MLGSGSAKERTLNKFARRTCLNGSSCLKPFVLIAVGTVICVCGNPAGAASPSAPLPAPPTAPGSLSNPSAPPATPTPAPGFVVLTQPVKVKIVYGEVVLPVGTKLPLVSSDATTAQINYMGEKQTIPIGVIRFEAAERNALPSGADLSPVAPAKPPALSSVAPSSQQPTLSLQPGYDSRMQGGDITMRELQSLLSRHCTQAVDLGGRGINIYNGVRYLMDSDQAVSTLGLRANIPSRVKLATPGFPRDSTYYIGYDGAFEGHFNRLYLVTDVANKVVGLQLVDEHPKSFSKSDRALEEATWNTYNFINTRLRASDAVRVEAKSDREGDAIRIETHMYQLVRKRLGRSYSSRYEEMENTKLLIPIPFARIILHCAQIGLSKS